MFFYSFKHLKQQILDLKGMCNTFKLDNYGGFGSLCKTVVTVQ